MSLNVIKKVIDLGDGRTIEIETGKLAKQADGSVVVKMGDTMLLATVVSSPEAKEGVDFLPLSVDYQEKYAATGRIPGGFLRREARLSDYEVLISRLVDRALRPLFPEDYHADTQVMISLISADKDIMPDALAGLAASAALAVSDIPFNGPISEVRVAKIDGKLVINPTLSELENATLEFIVAGSEHDINMVEGESKEIQEDELVEAIKFAHAAIKVQCLAQKELTIEVGKTEKRVYSHEHSNEDLKKAIYAATYEKVYAVASSASAKDERAVKFKQVRDEYIETLGEIDDITKALAKKYYHDVEYDAIRNLVLDEGKRLDGRTTTQIRPIWSEVGYLPSAHGSAVFTRGETQSLTSVTLGAKDDEQMIDGAFINGYQKFMLHYNFPGFSTGEVRPNRGAGRREIGHGNLAQRSLKQVLPSEDENPYTIRVVSDILESNGSSSMATVCAGTLALMDAGVKIKEPVSGIAMGLITNEMGTKYAILSDILGDEDHLGDMDFKVTGTKNGIVAVQMDLKINGLSYEVLANALNQAKDGRLHILGEMAKTIQQPREDYKPHAPRIVTIKIDKEFIGAVIGPGGKIIQEMQRETGATISIEEKDNQGIVQVFADNKASIDAALGRIRAIASKPEVGEIYEGKVKSIMPFGAFVEIMPGKDGLLHISEIDHRRIETMDGIFQIGDEVRVKLLDVDKQGKLKLSRKVLLPKPEPKQNN
ncbi:polyribonucleotide nucleotidyltransferase [Mucilaginibacter sp. SJ]|uniref:polyribonucleotide nucleotidyltransferase n=1 Tax=Mucilaginibacter sp. SJ TaxID=3029053 RepID=UPI0023A93FF0|nr:polyribonucleotide nucleotidyltransferase [Mucilaginibacter sp. SJ]WEA02554.1 polyribonucleotide nucleotidyltransferase [Mucilaginibacter sp. SJ]